LTTEPDASVIAALNAAPLVQSQDKLDLLRQAVARCRDLELAKKDQEQALKETNKKLQEEYFQNLPVLMEQAGVAEIVLEAEGNNPPVKAKSDPYYRANIAADWPEEQRALAFKWLDDNGHGDLIKTDLTISFPREQRSKAIELQKFLTSKGFTVSVGQVVHWATLTSWLKEMIEKHKIIPPLETLGATVGQVVKLKNQT
jgi:hypothetical protein